MPLPLASALDNPQSWSTFKSWLVSFLTGVTDQVNTAVVEVTGPLSSQVGQVLAGHPPLASGTAIGNSNIYYYPTALQAYDQRLTTVEVGNGVARTGVLVVAFVNGDGTLTLISRQPLLIAAGAAVVAGLDVAVPAGCVVGFGGVINWLYDAAGSLENWATTAVPSTSTAKTITTANPVRLRFTLQGVTRSSAATSTTRAAQVGQAQAGGWPAPVVSTGTAVPANYTFFDIRPVQESGYITQLVIGAGAPATAKVLVATITTAGVVTIVSSTDVLLVNGVATIDCAIAVAAGQFVGVANGYRFQNSVNTYGLTAWTKGSAVVNGDTLTQNSLHRYEVQWTIKSGALGDVAKLQAKASGGGYGLMDAADTTGVADATALLATARSAHPTPYIPPGTFAVTAVPVAGAGLWGPGKIKLSGERYFVPPAPYGAPVLSALRSALQQHISAGDVLALIGDSISHWAYAGTGPAHWFNLLTKFANLGIAADEPLMTALRPSSTYTTDFYGLTTAGGVSTGTAGPIGESLILAVGASMTFTGAYEQVDVFYTQGAGAGTLSFSYNGGAAFKTVVAAGATELDKFSGPSLTSQAASGTYTITASVAPVEVTGLLRLGVKAAGSAPRLRTARMAHGSYTFANFGAAARTAILKQATYAGGKAVPIIALGINDSFGTAAATIVANATALIDALQAGGVERIYALPPIRPTSAWDASYTGGRKFDDAAGPLRKLYRDRSIIVLPVDGRDWAAEALLSDGLHPNAAGNDELAQMVALGVAGI
jgi:hypothetical protein